MKLSLSAFFLFLSFQIVNAQYPCFHQISTNPSNPINNQVPSKRNFFFDWHQPVWSQKALPNQGVCTRADTMTSPYFRLDNLEELRESQDMNWSDGWELLVRRVGLSDANIPLPDNDPDIAVIMYNKYTGILRVLLKTCRGADYNAARIKIQFHELSTMQTDLLEFSRQNISSLNKTFSPTIFDAGSRYTNNDSKWFYADFPMMFDPCTCLYPSKLKVVSELVSTSSIIIDGGITGDIYSQDVGGKAQINKPGTYSWKDFSSSVNGKVTSVHGSINQFISATQNFGQNIYKLDTTKKTNAILSLGNYLKNNKFLQTGLNSVPWLKTALGVVDAFIGGGKTVSGPQEVKLLPLTVNLTAKFSGSINVANTYHNVVFTNPGSKDAEFDLGGYPYYNEVMGVFNLIKTPVVYHEYEIDDITEHGGTQFGDRVRVDRYKLLLDSLKYVVNPAAGMTIQNMQVALVVEAEPQASGICVDANETRQMGPDFFFEGVDALTHANKFRTDYYDVNCFNARVFQNLMYFGRPGGDEFEYVPGINCWLPSRKAYLKFMINFKRDNATSNTQNVLHVLTYPVNVKSFPIAANFTDNQNCADSSIIPQATNSEVNVFCGNTVEYYSMSIRPSAYMDSVRFEQKVMKEGLAISPNPTNNGRVLIKIKKQNNYLRNIRVIDNAGRVLFNSNEGNISLAEGFSKSIQLNVKTGTYHLIASTKNGVMNATMIVIK